jgi:hypothetical protein
MKLTLENLAAVLEGKGYAAGRLDALYAAARLIAALNSFEAVAARNAADLLTRLGFGGTD